MPTNPPSSTDIEKNVYNDVEAEAISLVRKEKATWETGTAFVTDKVAFQMRNLIKQCRKNYWSVYDVPNDSVSGRKKTWVPLTESAVEAAVKNIDLDTKDINFRAKHAKAIGLTALVRAIVKKKLDEIYFGEILDKALRTMAIDGTVVFKTYEEYDNLLKKKTLRIQIVDLLNFYIDPTVESIQDADAVIERAVLTPDEFKMMSGWINKDKITPQKNINRYDGEVGGYGGSTTTSGETPYVEVYERWGKMPKSLITGKREDENTYIDGHIVVSGLSSGGMCHLIEENKKGIKPYEEAWYTRIQGRWYGKGIAEKLLYLQLWLNTIVNIRINRAFVSQLGIFKIKRNAGITPQSLSRLSANGAVLVESMDDIQQMVVQEASAASYKDEEDIQTWANRVTSAFELVTGESLPGSTSATVGALQSRAAQSGFTIVKDGVGFFLQRWLKRHAIPILMKDLKGGDPLRITGEAEELRELDERIVNHQMAELLDDRLKAISAGDISMMFTEEMVMKERERALAKLRASGRDRFIDLVHDIDPTEFDVQVYITNEELDKGVLAQNLTQLLQVVSAIPQMNGYIEPIVRQTIDLMGLDTAQMKRTETPMQLPTMGSGMQGMMGMGAQGGVMGGMNMMGSQPGVNMETSEMEQMMKANTRNR